MPISFLKGRQCHLKRRTHVLITMLHATLIPFALWQTTTIAYYLMYTWLQYVSTYTLNKVAMDLTPPHKVRQWLHSI